MSVDVGPVSEFPEKCMRIVDIGTRQIGVVRWGEGILSGRLTATHPGDLMLDDGAPTLACPWHGWEFDLDSGRALLDPKLRVRTFAARTANGRVLVDINESAAAHG